jgi:hypothetical protein
MNMTNALTSRQTGNAPEQCVAEVLDLLIVLGEEHEGLWPSCVLFEDRRIPAVPPGPLGGQRSWDRAVSGCNLMHDLPALGLLYALADACDRSDYRLAADRYLETFVNHCTATETGLFPWGEHAFWDLLTDKAGSSLEEAGIRYGSEPFIWHDHLRQAPPWFWEKVAAISPRVLDRFAEGLDRHWVTDARDEYNRHAILDQVRRTGPDKRSCDFPRHSGFYVCDLACAYRRNPRPEIRASLIRYADYWWERRKDGECFLLESRTPADDPEFLDVLSASQTLSLGLSLLDAAEVLSTVDEGLSNLLSIRGAACCRKFLNAPHDITKGVFVSSYKESSRHEPTSYPVFGSVYGIYPLAHAALLCCAAYRGLGDEAFLDWAAAAGRTCIDPDWDKAEPANGRVYQGRMMTRQCVPALDVGLSLELSADLYELTGERIWLAEGMRMWERIRPVYFRAGLVSTASDGSWYEAQQGSAYLLHGAARLGHLAASGISIAPDYSAR